ncbi:MAG: apolipoprotein N-acyltransferase [Clostridia bacterium]|nr:apolipoprotein N-acyltransferase [Clostridia bacterium]
MNGMTDRIRALPKWAFWLLLLAGPVLAGFTVMFPAIGLLEWIAMIPSGLIVLTLASDESVRYRKLYWYGLAFFESYFLVIFHWFLYMYPLTFAGLSDAASVVVVVVAWLGLSMFQAVGAAVIFPLFALAVRGKWLARHTLIHPFLFAAMWTVLEWWQANSGWSGVPWGRLPLGQTGMLITVESAAYFGTYFVTFLMLSVGMILSDLMLHPDRRRLCGILAASMFLGNLALGGVRMLTYRDEGQPVTVAAAQGNMSSLDKWSGGASNRAETIYGDLIRKAAAEGAVLVVTPETCFPVHYEYNPTLQSTLYGLAEETDAVILAGVFTSGTGDDAGRDFNSVVAVLPDGTTDPVIYNKRSPVPFGEFVPWRPVIMFLIPPLAEVGMLDADLLIGEDSVVFDLPAGKVGSMICFDSIYETNALDSVRNGAELLAVSTNDSWFRDSRGVWMHNAQSALRAIETGRYVIRSGNTGVSSLITPLGKVEEKLDPLLTGYVAGDVYMNQSRTLYSVTGNIFAYLCIAFCAACVLAAPAEAVIDRIRRKKSERLNET